MKLFIPTIGTQMELAKEWSFTIHYEYRNDKALEYFGLMDEYEKFNIEKREHNESVREIFKVNNPEIQITYYTKIDGLRTDAFKKIVTIPKGSILIVDRVYIRNNRKEYDSLTFRLASTPTQIPKGKNKKLKSLCRFWAKLDDVNNMEIVDNKGTLFNP